MTSTKRPKRKQKQLIESFLSSASSRVWIETQRTLPIVDFHIVIPIGALHDPAGKEGLCAVLGRCMRRGTGKLKALQIDEKIEILGAQVSISASTYALRADVSVLRRNLEPIFDLVSNILLNPSLRTSDLEFTQRQIVSELKEAQDDDRWLANTQFRRDLFRKHALGRHTNAAKIEKLQTSDLKMAFELRAACAPLFGFSGDLSLKEAEQLVERYCGRIGNPAATATVKLPEPHKASGRQLVVIDKPERTQTQVFIGNLGTHAKDKDHFAMIVANAAFGGSFTARLMNEVRSKRGWSYGASSRLGLGHTRDAWYMYTFPSVEDVSRCIQLQLQLLEQWIDQGISQEELQFAKEFIANSYVFDIDTPSKRIDQYIDSALLDLPDNYFSDYLSNVSEVKLSEIKRALGQRLHAQDMLITLVTTAAGSMDHLQKIPDLSSIRVIPFDRI